MSFSICEAETCLFRAAISCTLNDLTGLRWLRKSLKSRKRPRNLGRDLGLKVLGFTERERSYIDAPCGTKWESSATSTSMLSRSMKARRNNDGSKFHPYFSSSGLRLLALGGPNSKFRLKANKDR